MNNSKAIFFGGKKCEHIANQLSSHYDNLLVFSICSDERISNELESYLYNIAEEMIPSRIIILGDFPVVPPEICPPSFEVLRILSTRTNKKVPIYLCWLDSGTIDLTPININFFLWHNKVIGEEYSDNVIIGTSITKKIAPNDYSLYLSIFDILKKRPIIEVNEDGFIYSIKFIDFSIYPKSIISRISPSEINIIYKIISKFSHLKILDLSFSSLKILPKPHHCKMLERLYLRGNSSLNLDTLEVFHKLKYLNISACGVKKIPTIIEKFSYLEHLLCYKNSIKNISNIKFPSKLVRLSLYRNNIHEGNIDFSSCTQIKEVNIGANPLNYIDIKLNPVSKSLVLRLRNTPKCLTTLVQTPYVEIDPIILID